MTPRAVRVLLNLGAVLAEETGGWREHDGPDRAGRCRVLRDAGDDPAGSLSRAAARCAGTTRPLHVLLAVSLGGSAILLFAMASGHLHGARATVGVIAALAEVALTVCVLARPSRRSSSEPLGNLAVAAFWLSSPARTRCPRDGWHRCRARWNRGPVGALALRPQLGSTWSSGTTVIGSVVPVAVAAVAIGGLFATTEAVHPASSSRPASPGGSSAALELATTVKVPGETSKTFQSLVAGNDTEQSELKKWVPLNAQDQVILTQQLTQAYQAAMRFPTVASAKAAGMILAGGMAPGVGAHYQLINGDVFKGSTQTGVSTRRTQRRGSTPARRTTRRSWASCTSR